MRADSSRRRAAKTLRWSGFVVGVVVAGHSQIVDGQQPPWPNGCSVPGDSQWVQQGLNNIFLDVCNQHDQCWGKCNGPEGLFLGLGHKAQCDVNFLAGMEAVCIAYSAVLVFPIGGLEDVEDFLEFCTAAAAGIYAVIASPVTNGYYWTSQCFHGCNPDGCTNASLPWNQACGNGQCYVQINYDPCLLNPFYPWCDPCLYEPSLPQCQDECVLNPGSCPVCPLIIDLDGDGVRLSGPMPPVGFDLDGDGLADLTSWTRVAADEAFLVLDRNGNGMIDDGTELFGSAVTTLSGKKALHGFEALADLDDPAFGGNLDGAIDEQDATFPLLALWRDANRSGTVEPGVFSSLQAMGVASISLGFGYDPSEDVWGNRLLLWGFMTFEDGRVRRLVDVFFDRS
jgi:hypothetical protein